MWVFGRVRARLRRSLGGVLILLSMAAAVVLEGAVAQSLPRAADLRPERLTPRAVSSAPFTRPLAIGLNSGSWTPIGPAPTVNGLTDYTENGSGRVAALAAHPSDANVVYVAAAGGGVWKTTTGGASWTPLTDAQATLFMGAIAIAPSNPNVIYAGTGEAHMGPSKARAFRTNIYPGRGVLKSLDGGSTWTLLGAGLFDRRTIARLVVDPTDPMLVYAAVGALATNGLPGNTGIWKSADGGSTWSNTTLSISTTAAFSDVVMDPSNRQTLYAAVGAPGGDAANGVYKTTDGGAHWSVAGTFPVGDPLLGRIAVAISQAAPQKLYASIARPGPPQSQTNSLYQLMTSSDGGTTWAALPAPGSICSSDGTLINYLASSGDYHMALAVDPSNPAIVYAGGICLIQSIDGGNSWSAIAQGETAGPHRDHQALGFDAAGKLLNGNDGGIWRLDDPNLLTWANLNGNLQITQFIGIDVHPTDPNVVYGGTQDLGSERFQGDPRWMRLMRGDGGASAVSVTDPSRVYQVTRIASSSPNIFRRSDDGGNNWSVKVIGIDPADPKTFYPPIVMSSANSNRLLLGTTRVYETTDAADTWSPISTPGANGWMVSDNIDSLALAPSGVNTIYASAGGHIFGTIDHGASWQQRDIPGTVDHFAGLVVDPANSSVVYAVRDRFGGGHVFRSTNGGQAWSDISGDLPDLPAYTLALDTRVTPNVLYVGLDSGVYASADLGGHWVRFGAGLPNAQVIELKLNTGLNILAAGTHGRGVWEILVPAPSPPTATPTATTTPPRTNTPTATLTPTVTLTPPATPTPNPCAANLGVTVSADGTGRVQVTITARTGTLAQVQSVADAHVPNPNVYFDVLGGPTNAVTLNAQPGTAQFVFFVHPVTAGQAVTAPLVITDGCGGQWSTLVGGGPSVFVGSAAPASEVAVTRVNATAVRTATPTATATRGVPGR